MVPSRTEFVNWSHDLGVSEQVRKIRSFPANPKIFIGKLVAKPNIFYCISTILSSKETRTNFIVTCCPLLFFRCLLSVFLPYKLIITAGCKGEEEKRNSGKLAKQFWAAQRNDSRTPRDEEEREKEEWLLGGQWATTSSSKFGLIWASKTSVESERKSIFEARFASIDALTFGLCFSDYMKNNICFWRGNAYIGFASGVHSALTINRPSFPLDSFFGALKKLEIKMQHGDFFPFCLPTLSQTRISFSGLTRSVICDLLFLSFFPRAFSAWFFFYFEQFLARKLLVFEKTFWEKDVTESRNREVANIRSGAECRVAINPAIMLS